MNVPDPSAPFAEKMAYYRSQHTSRGVRATHMVGIPTLVLALPLIPAEPYVGVPMLAAGWLIQVVGHRVFEHNNPALTRGPITYQLTGLAFWCEEIGELLARRYRRRNLRKQA